MLSSILKDRVQIQLKVATQTALGEAITWTPVETRFARVIPLDAKARAVYMQMQSEVTHKVVFRGSVSLKLGKNRLLWGSKTLEPVEPVQYTEESAIVMVKEV
ncbi:hypothetical protein ES708_06123 [subsurface metagenome]